MTAIALTRWSEIRAHFDELVALDAVQRSDRLARLSESDLELARAVELLIAADANAGEHLQRLEFGVAELLLASSPCVADTEFDPLNLANRTISHFHVLEPLAAGGMGVVYRAEDTRLGRVVALKVPLPQYALSATVKERFLREARSIGALDHPNVCTIYEAGESEDGHVFLAMPLYSGATLKARLATGAPLPIEEALDIARQIAEGLACAHEAGVVHRDLKPANVMLLPDGTVKILDFGLAKVKDVSHSSGALVGTASYMAPEQIRGGVVDERADLWALGVVLYEMMLGVRPFRGDHEISIIHAILNESPKDPSAVRREVPRAVDEIVLGLLEKDISRRYANARQVSTDIAAVLRGEAPASRRREPSGPSVQPPKNHTARYVLSLVAVATISAAAIGAWRSMVVPRSTRPPNAQALELFNRAHGYYLRIGSAERSSEVMKAASSLYRRAIALDRDFAAAHAELASTLAYAYWHTDRRPDVLEEIRTEAQTALRLRPDLAEAHFALSDYWLARGDQKRGLAELERANAASPKNVEILRTRAAMYLESVRFEEALALYRRAQELDPTNYGIISDLAQIYAVMGRYEDGIRQLDHRLTLEPDAYVPRLIKAYLYYRGYGILDSLATAIDSVPAEWDPRGFATYTRVRLAQLQRRPADGLAALDRSRYAVIQNSTWNYSPRSLLRGYLYAMAGDSTRALINFDSARVLLEDTIATRAGRPPVGPEMDDFVKMHMALAKALAGLGRSQEAVKEARSAMAVVPPDRALLRLRVMPQVAEIMVRAGDKKGAVRLLEQVLAQGGAGLVSVASLRIEPWWDPLRTEPRFQRLLEKYANTRFRGSSR